MTMLILAICVRMCQINIYWGLGTGEHEEQGEQGRQVLFPMPSPNSYINLDNDLGCSTSCNNRKKLGNGFVWKLD